MLPAADTTMTPPNEQLRLPPGHLGFPLSLNQQAEKGVIVLAVVTDSNYQREIDLPLPNGNRKEYVWNAGDSLRVSFSSACRNAIGPGVRDEGLDRPSVKKP